LIGCPPNFIKLLTPGAEYTGGIQFFRENSHLVEEIPLTDIPTATNPLHEPPESLVRAVQVSFWGLFQEKSSETSRIDQ
jgi:hypothetical protein